MPRRPRIYLADHPQPIVQRIYKRATWFKVEPRVRMQAGEDCEI